MIFYTIHLHLSYIFEKHGIPIQPDDSVTVAGALPPINRDDMQYFGRLMEEVDEDLLSKEELKERQIMTLLLKIKSVTPPQRKTAMRLMSPTLEDQEHHLLVKVITNGIGSYLKIESILLDTKFGWLLQQTYIKSFWETILCVQFHPFETL